MNVIELIEIYDAIITYAIHTRNKKLKNNIEIQLNKLYDK